MSVHLLISKLTSHLTLASTASDNHRIRWAVAVVTYTSTTAQSPRRPWPGRQRSNISLYHNINMHMFGSSRHRASLMYSSDMLTPV
jgi:hypothetical protein